MRPPLENLRPFDHQDFDAWAGVEHPEPLICCTPHATVIVDGPTVILVVDPDNGDTIEYGTICNNEFMACSFAEGLLRRIKAMEGKLTPREMALYLDGLAYDCQLQRNN